MAVSHREATSSAQTEGSIQQGGDRSSENVAAELSDLSTGRPAEVTAMAPAPSSRDVDPPTIELRVGIAEAHGVTVVAVTTDNELRAVLAELLPRDGVAFFDSPEQALGRPVPNNCAVLIVEKTVSRSSFEQLKSHLGVSARALVSVMVGSEGDGSSLVGLLSAGHIDRFMVKPFNVGPTRNALRSALQQFRSTRSREQADRTSKPNVVSFESARVHDPNGQAPRKRSAQAFHADKSSNKRRDRKDITAGARQPIAKTRAAVERVAAKQQNVREDDSGRLAPSLQQLSLPSWSLAFAAVIAMLGFIAWGIATRAPELNANREIAGHLAAAQRAFELGNLVDPPELSAAHFYAAALELDPKNVAAKHGLDAIADRLIAEGKELVVAGDLLRAQSTLDTVRRLQPTHRELADVTASLLRARDAERVTIRAAHSLADENIETISVSPQSSVQGASPAIAKASSGAEPKVKIAPQHRERALQADAAITGKKDSSPTPSTFIPSRASPQVEHERAHTEQLSLRTEPERSLESPPAESSVHVAPKIVSTLETNPAEPSVGMDTNSTAARVSTSVQNSSIGTVSAPSSPMIEPTLIKYVEPAYPFKARASGAEGWLDVYFLVKSDGSVIAPRVEQGTLGDEFRRAALAAVSHWKYSSAPNTATPNRPMNVRLRFRLAG